MPSGVATHWGAFWAVNAEARGNAVVGAFSEVYWSWR